jgi:ribosomal protein S18 acetylase RimI-like enzyme
MDTPDTQTETLFVREATAEDRAWAVDLWVEHYASVDVVSRGVRYHAPSLPAYAAVLRSADGEQPVGIATYRLDDAHGCELVTIDSAHEHMGVGTALLDAVEAAARAAGAARVWLITSNDNLNALRFYQRRGYRLAAVHRDAIVLARQIKPEIPLVGDFGIPLTDEIELEKLL